MYVVAVSLVGIIERQHQLITRGERKTNNIDKRILTRVTLMIDYDVSAI